MIGSSTSPVAPGAIQSNPRFTEIAVAETLEILLQSLPGALFESAPDAVFVSDSDGRILQLNAAAEKQFGYTHEQLNCQKIEKLFPGRFRDNHRGQREKLVGKGWNIMKSFTRVALSLGLVLFPAALRPAQAQTTPKAKSTQAPSSPEQQTADKNTKAYIDLMRRNVRQDKAEIMGAMLALGAQDAAKFWPIYSEYDAQLTKLNDQRVANIQDYANNYDNLTDAKADELIQNAISFQKQRAELLYSTYGKVRQALGGVTAARFAQIENQLLLLIDLQINAALPIASPKS